MLDGQGFDREWNSDPRLDMEIGDLVCDPDIMRSKYGWCVDRNLGLIIGDEESEILAPKSYCGCYEEKFIVWWINADTIFQQCACELEVINDD